MIIGVQAGFCRIAPARKEQADGTLGPADPTPACLRPRRAGKSDDMKHLVVTRLAVALLVVALFALTGCNQASVPAPGPTVIYVVRHAEKATDPKDPPLTPAGAVRAEALARVLENVKIDAIYSSKTQRTENTVRPLSEKIHIPISYGAASLDDPNAYAKELATEVLAKHRGQNILIVNHSNTVPVIVETLSGQTVSPMGDFEYGTLFIVTVPASGPASVVRAQYGQPDGQEASTAPQAATLHSPSIATAGFGRRI